MYRLTVNGSNPFCNLQAIFSFYFVQFRLCVQITTQGIRHRVFICLPTERSWYESLQDKRNGMRVIIIVVIITVQYGNHSSFRGGACCWCAFSCVPFLLVELQGRGCLLVFYVLATSKVYRVYLGTGTHGCSVDRAMTMQGKVGSYRVNNNHSNHGNTFNYSFSEINHQEFA